MTYPENIRAAFREVALGLMEWAEPPLALTNGAFCNCGETDPRSAIHSVRCSSRKTYRPYDPQGEVEPFNVQADWEENL